jgi:hypothetical protein
MRGIKEIMCVCVGVCVGGGGGSVLDVSVGPSLGSNRTYKKVPCLKIKSFLKNHADIALLPRLVTLHSCCKPEITFAYSELHSETPIYSYQRNLY